MSVALDLDSLIQRISSIKLEKTPAERFFREEMPGRLPGCEVREQQIQLAQAIELALKDKRHVISEAGTGTGKSLAYLVPVAQHIKRNGGRAVVSTGTIALQEQLISKDIPFLNQAMGLNFTAKLAKGKGNYLCLIRLRDEMKQVSLWEGGALSDIDDWAQKTLTGDRADLLIEAGEVWGKVCADDSCTGKRCPRLDECFYQKAKASLVSADIIVCNHSLFFIDLMLKVNTDGYVCVLPEYQAVVFDEAHHVESVAREAMSTQVSSFRLPVILTQLRKRPGCDFSAVQDALAVNEAFFAAVAAGAKADKFLLPQDPKLMAMCKELCKAVVGVANTFDTSFIGDREEKLFNMLDKYISDLAGIMRAEQKGTVFWVELAGAAKRRVVLHATPINISGVLSETLFNNSSINTVVMTSATVSTGGSFRHIKSSVGLGSAVEIQLDSSFDYQSQCLLYLPPGLPDPKGPDFHEKIVPFIENILLKTNGRAFVLFTSYKGMNGAYGRLAGRLKWTVLKQGDMPKRNLLEAFRADVHSVLFATASFWEGVDVQGEALSCVIIVKLPFAVPDDPITEAKVKAIEQAGGNAFFDYSMPEAIIRLKQGFGRLIRTREDRGIVAILDPRVKSKAYGRKFINSLPRCREISSLENVDLFLKRGGA